MRIPHFLGYVMRRKGRKGEYCIKEILKYCQLHASPAELILQPFVISERCTAVIQFISSAAAAGNNQSLSFVSVSESFQIRWPGSVREC